MVDPRVRRRLRRREERSEESESDQDDDETDPVDQPDSSLEDLVQPADPSQFDRTFLAGDADLNIEGSFDPVAGQRQVLPRVAYVLSYQLVYNEERGRWEPDTGNGNRGAGNRATVLTKPPNQSFSGVGVATVVAFNDGQLDQLDGADVPNNQVIIQVDGTYRLTAQLTLKLQSTPARVFVVATRNGSRLAGHQMRARDFGDSLQTLTITRPVELTAGDSIDLVVQPLTQTTADLTGGQSQNYLGLTRLS